LDVIAQEKFAKHFDNKVKEVIQTIDLDENAYYGKKHVTGFNGMFMCKDSLDSHAITKTQEFLRLRLLTSEHPTGWCRYTTCTNDITVCSNIL
jgi:hypothetical protein